MAMKVDFIFSMIESGWTETFYHAATDINTAMAAAKTLALERCKILCVDAYLSQIRVSSTTVLNDSIVTFDPTYYERLTLKGDAAQVAFLCRLSSGSLYRRSYMIRGCPDEWVYRKATTGILTWNNIADAAIKQYLAAIPTAGMTIQVMTKVGDGVVAYPIVNVAVVATIAGATAVLSAMPLGGLAQGDKIAIHGAKEKLRCINGVWPLVKDPATNPAIIRVPFAHLDGWDLSMLTKAKMNPVVIKYVPINDVQLEDIRGRQTGGNFFHAVGRRRKKVC